MTSALDNRSDAVPTAITDTTTRGLGVGVGVGVAPIFSVARHQQVAGAYPAALEGATDAAAEVATCVVGLIAPKTVNRTGTGVESAST
ncbi:hypothetical protein C4J65_02390 [Streptomyces sp. CB09001]|uniref:hypothetical protein n=1 Tax=Streptomyces sp. CB09001 TaxID=2083284 RepID=UPI000E2142CE|nr:hypothetical protein [Streptomyces sp. CB09001]AXL87288.1 hypothetical protein C4J65_02390 [Streptomyces sp. CB09001]